ncbi:MAG: thioesterase family protein [Ilumatobacteraceae bacterium]
MGDFAVDTELTPNGDGSYSRLLHRDWEIWGPNGGYMGALALRAAGLHCGRARPANITVHFLGVANFDEPVRVVPTTLRATKVATSVGVSIEQAGRPVLQAMVWALDDGLGGLRHAHGEAPAVAGWRDLPTLQERFAADGLENQSPYRFWDNFEQRPTEWISDWDNRSDQPPVYENWLRFQPASPTDDPWLAAGRLLLLVDLGGWPAVSRAHVQGSYVAPSIDVSCEFHRLPTQPGWYFLHGVSPHSGDGLVASRQEVWSDTGELLASGISHLLCRPVR